MPLKLFSLPSNKATPTLILPAQKSTNKQHQQLRQKFPNEGDVINFIVNERFVFSVTRFKHLTNNTTKALFWAKVILPPSRPQLFTTRDGKNGETFVKNQFIKIPSNCTVVLLHFENLMKHQIKLETFQKISAVLEETQQ
jgi:hypothetical protein